MGDGNVGFCKSAFAQRLAAMEISEEYEFFVKVYEMLELTGLWSSEALLYALQHAFSSSLASDFS